MRILYVSQYFPPEMGAPSARVSELAREWVRQGHEVTVLTGFAHHPTGVLADADRGFWFRREDQDGIRVARSYVWATPNKGVVKRMLSYASFMASAMFNGALRIDRPEIVVATSPQLLCGFAGYVLARRFRVPFVFEVRDLWPESVIAVAAMGENLIIRGLKQVAAFLYAQSDRIVTVGAGYARKIHEWYALPEAKMAVLPNGVDTSLFVPGVRDNALRTEYDWGDRFVVLYLGTHGMAHALDSVVETARLMRSRDDVRFAFVGEGAEKEKLKSRAQELALKNVQFIDQQPKDRVPLFYAACDLGLVTLRDTPLFQEVLPSKIFEYLAMERPILITVGGEARRLVETSGGGAYVTPEDPAALAEAIDRTLADHAALAAMGSRGRSYVLKHYDRRVQAGQYLRVLRAVLDGEDHVPVLEAHPEGEGEGEHA